MNGPVVNQIRDRADFELMLLGELLQLWALCHGAIFIHHLNNH